MPRTRKTSGTTTTKRSTTRNAGSSKHSATTKTSAAKRKTAKKTTAPRTRNSTGSRRTSSAKTTAHKSSRLFKFKLLATLIVCFAIVVLALLGTVFYEKLVPVKAPAAAKNGTATTIQIPGTTIPAVSDKPEITPAKTPIGAKPGGTTVVEPATSTPDQPGTEPSLLAQNGTTTPAVTPGTDKVEKPPVVLTPPESGKPKLALIFDDVGYDLAGIKKLQDLKIPLTFSILPFSPHGQTIAKSAPKHIEVMVHVPMEALNGDSDKEQGLLRSNMTEAELAQILRADIDRIPNAKGINNHTGSKLTQELVPMQVVMLVLKEKGLYFVDSLTSDKSVANTTAEMLLVPTIARNVFLDHVADVTTIKTQLYRAVNLAKKNGYAVAIGHPRPLTLEVVLKELPKIAKEAEIEFVPASVLVK